MTDPLENLSEFPYSFVMKAVGKNSGDFQELVTTIVRRHVRDLEESAITVRLSKDGKYLSVTASFLAESQDQLEALYQELNEHERVIMVLC